MSNPRNKADPSYQNNPSVFPLKSPSPDFTIGNAISPTSSPTRGEIKRRQSPSMPVLNMGVGFHSKYQTQTPSTFISKEQAYFSKERDRVEVPAFQYYSAQQRERSYHSGDLDNRQELIIELKKILAMISNSQFVSEFDHDETLSQAAVRQQNQKLKLQNQALIKILNEERSRQPAVDIEAHEELISRLNFVFRESQELKASLTAMKDRHENEIQSLIQTNQNQTIKVKSLEQANKFLETETQQLLKLLTEKDQSERRLYNEMRESSVRPEQREVLNRTPSILSETDRERRLSVIKQHYQESINQMQENMCRGVSEVTHNAGRHFKEADLKVKELQLRLDTLSKFISASLRIKGKTEFLQKSRMIRETYQNMRHDQTKKLHDIIHGLNSEKSQLSKQYEFRLESQDKNLYESQVLIEKNREKLNHLQIRVEEYQLQIQNLRNQLNVTEDSKQHEIDRLKNRMTEKSEQNQSLSERIDQKITDIQMSTSGKELQWQEIVKQKDRQLQEYRGTQAKVRELVTSYQKEIDIKNKELLRKGVQLKELSVSKSDQETQLSSQIKLLNFQKNDLREKMDRTLKNHHFQLSELSIRERQLSQEMQERDSRLQHIVTEINSLQAVLTGKDKTVLQLQSQIRDLNATISSNHGIKQALEIRQRQIQAQQNTLRNDLSRETELWRRKAHAKTDECKALHETITKLRSNSIINQLTEIKELIKSNKSEQLEIQLQQVANSYQRLSIELESKLSQIERLARDKIQLKDRAVEHQHKKVALQQKISYLQKNVEIYANELRQRKELCQAMIQQKSALEKEVLLIKKGTIDHRNISTSIEKILLVSKKIDQLIFLETEREKTEDFL